jgi:O-antigen/teichoic acid export membrane protein
VTGPPLVEPRRAFGWGFVSQIASAATNFGLSWLAARMLGPDGLGVVFLGFSCYLIALGFQRALLSDPLVASSAAMASEDRADATRHALALALAWSLAGAVLLGLVGLLVPGDIGRGALLFVPWLVPALVQDFWRMVLFRDGRGRAGAANDLVWLAVMAATAPLAFLAGSAWAAVGSWGAGALAGTIAGFVQTHARPARLAPAVHWWRLHAWRLGRWLGAESIVYVLGAQALTLLLAVVLDTSSVGGIRAVQAAFAPLSVIGPALGLPGFPALARRAAVSTDGARKLAAGLGGVAAACTAVYVAIAALGGGRLLGLVFGDSFRSFASLVWPIGCKELLVAPILGFTLLLKAQGRGGALLGSRALTSAATLLLGVGLAVAGGILGAAWGIALGAGVGSLAVFLLAVRTPAAEPAPGAPRLWTSP